MNGRKNYRKRQRYPASAIEIAIRRRAKLSFLAKYTQVEAIDFNRNGVGIWSDTALSLGQALELKIGLANQGNQRLRGVVYNCKRIEHRYRVGIQFDTTFSKLMLEDVEAVNLLESIETELSHIAALTENANTDIEATN